MNITRASRTGEEPSPLITLSVFALVIWAFVGGFIWLDVWIDGIILLFFIMIFTVVYEIVGGK